MTEKDGRQAGAPPRHASGGVVDLIDLDSLLGRGDEQVVSDRLYEAILRNIPDGIIVFDHDGKTVFANESVAHMAGRPASQLRGSTLVDVLLAIDPAAETKIFIGYLQGQGKAPVRLRWRDRTLSVSFAPVRLFGDELPVLLALFRDVTPEMVEQGKRDQMLVLAAQDMQAPLSTIVNYLAMMERDRSQDDAQQLKLLHRSRLNAHWLSLLVDNLLDQARIQAGLLEGEPSMVSPREVVVSVAEFLDVLARDAGLTLTVDIADDVPTTVEGNRQHLYRVLMNLVGNAIKFTDKGGVTIAVRRLGSDHWSIAVSDTGCGIPREARERIFEPFERVERQGLERRRGTGIGLFIVKQLVASTGGRIALESEIGRGSTFTVTWPLLALRS